MEDELYHYGVRGMRWGVHRSLYELYESNRTGSKGGHNHAVASLNTHRDKINKKLISLKAKKKKLENEQYKSAMLNCKVSKLQKNIAKNNAKIAKNEKLQKMFKQSLNSINDELVKNGQDFLYMKPNGMPYTLADYE